MLLFIQQKVIKFVSGLGAEPFVTYSNLQNKPLKSYMVSIKDREPEAPVTFLAQDITVREN